MITFKELSIKNFLSYGESTTVINLDTIGTTLMVGEDLDNTASGTGANGVGKSVWVNALVYGLYGKPISDISMDNLVNNINKKNMQVNIEFEKDNQIITVRRARKEKGNGNYAKVFLRPIGTKLDETQHDVTPAGVNDINDYVTDILGIPYELFVRIVAFAATHTPFLSLPVRHASKANQSDIMEELFRLTQLSSKADGIKVQIKDAKQSLEIKIRHNEQLEKEHERHNTQLVSAQERVNNWENQRDNSIEQLKSDLLQSEAVPIEKQEKLYKSVDDLNSKLVKEKEIQGVIEKEVTEVNSKLTVTQAQLLTVQTEKNKIIEWKEENVKAIANTKKNADELTSIHVMDEQKKLHKTVEDCNNALDDFYKYEKETKVVLVKNDTDITNIVEEIEHLQDAKCPYCLQQYEDAPKKIKECNELLAEFEKLNTETKKSLEMVQGNITSEENEIKELEDNITMTEAEILRMEHERENSVIRLEELLNTKCPHGDVSQVDELLNAVNELEKDIKKYNSEIDELGGGLVDIDGIVDGIESEIKECKSGIIIDSLDDLYEIKNEIKQIKKDIKDANEAVNPHLESLQELKDIELDPIDMDSINKLNNLITHQNYLVKLLTKKDSFIRKNLLTKNLTFLNQRLAFYLSQLGLPHKVEFTHEMTADITQFGRGLDFGNLSSGQKARVNLALSFSFRDVLQKSHDTINVCMLDEVLDVGLDSVGVQNAAKMLKRKAIDENLALYIISHRDEVSNIFDNRMTVQMEKGFSYIKIEK